jgi:hypothetical protein
MPLKTVTAAALCFNEKRVDGIMQFIHDECLIYIDQKLEPICGVENLRKFYIKGFADNPFSELSLESPITTGTVLMTRIVNLKSGLMGKNKPIVSMWVYQVDDHKIKVMHEFTTDYKTTQVVVG